MAMTKAAPHVPVMCAETLAGLALRVDGTYVDATYGRGGHSRALLAQLGPQGRLLAVDRDPAAVADATALSASDGRVAVCKGRLSELKATVDQSLCSAVDGVLFDLGVSSPQLDEPERGFSFNADGPLDMRMDPTSSPSAADLLASASAAELTAIFKAYGEEPRAARLARAIVEQRALTPLTRTAELARLVVRAIGVSGPRHPATRVFQALRIAVNGELDELSAALPQAEALLRPGGRLAVISFHSLEDRIVKRYFHDHARAPAQKRFAPVAPFTPTLRLVGAAQHASQAEIGLNPRARSATLRIAERCA